MKSKKTQVVIPAPVKPPIPVVIEECRLCQESINSGEEAKVIEPNGTITHFCVSCMTRLVTHLTSGSAENQKAKN